MYGRRDDGSGFSKTDAIKAARLISAVIITQNEEHVIGRCLASLTWADEIVVVDGGSRDKTLELIRNPQAPWASRIKLVERPFQSFRDQRNFSIDNAKNDWVLVVDSDEECSPELAKKIQSFFKDGKTPEKTAYKVRRQEYFLNKPIHYGIWNPSYQDRFFHREGIRYINEVHEYPPFPPNPGRLVEPLHHWPDFNPDKFLEKMNKYTSIEALDRYRQGQRTNLFRLLGAFPAMFLKNYFYYKAYRDGMHGVVISLLEGLSRVVRHVKIWRLQRTSLQKIEGRS